MPRSVMATKPLTVTLTIDKELPAGRTTDHNPPLPTTRGALAWPRPPGPPPPAGAAARHRGGPRDSWLFHGSEPRRPKPDKSHLIASQVNG